MSLSKALNLQELASKKAPLMGFEDDLKMKSAHSSEKFPLCWSYSANATLLLVLSFIHLFTSP